MQTAANHDNRTEEFDSEPTSSEKLDLQFYLRIMRKNKWPITLFTALVTLLAGYYAYTVTPVYQSTSTLLIESQKANILSIEELYGVEQENSDYYGTQFEILKSRSLAERVVRRLGLDQQATVVADAPAENADSPSSLMGTVKALVSSAKQMAGLEEAADAALVGVGETNSAAVDTTGVATTNISEIVSDEMRFSKAVSNFRRTLKVSPVRKTKLVKISYQSPDPEFAALAANTVAEEYITSVLDGRLRMKEKASAWMNGRVAELKEKLDESELRLIQFKQDNGLIDVNGSVGRLNEQELLLATTELAQAKSELSDVQDLYRQVQSMQSRSPELLETVPVIQDDLLVRSVKIEFGQRQRELDELRNRYGSKHPKIIDAQSRMDSLRSTMDGHIRRVISSIEKDFQLRRQRVAAIQATLNRGKENIQIIGQKKFKLDALEREVATNRDIYNQFFSRITETDSSDGLDAANARVADYANAAQAPIKPRKQVIIALAALGSLLLAMLLAILAEHMDESIRGTQDVENRLGVRLLGILPIINKGLLGGSRALPLNPTQIIDKKGTFVEAVNTARTALTIRESNPKIILVTSSVPGEGKSTTSLNLAYSFSQLERVLLIDCDMRRPSLAKAVGLDQNADGLSNLITRSASAKDCIRRKAIDSLDLLTSGPIPQQPLELLSSNRFIRILQNLSDHYDKIIIDSAPTQAVSDALVLSKLADAVVYVVKSHDTSYNLVNRGLARLGQVGAPIAGVLMTQVDVDKISSYGGDYYYQGYYDYYGYTDKSGQPSKGKIKLTPEELRQMKMDDDDVELDIGGFVNSPAKRRTAAAVPVAAGVVDPMVDDLGEFDLTARVPPVGDQRVNQSYPGRDRILDDLDLV